MAVVLPIHSHIDFSNPMENDYCPNEEEVTTVGNENESASSPTDMFSNRGADSTNSDNELADVDAQSSNSMDIGESSGDCDDDDDDEKADTLPLNVSAQNDSTTTTNEEEEQTPNESVDDDNNNYWSMDNEKSSTPEDENSEFISSLMAVDDIVEPSETKVSNIVDAILMEEPKAEEDDDIMNVDLNEIPTVPAILLDEIHATKEDNDDDNNNNNNNNNNAMNIGSPMSVLAEVIPEAEKTPSYGGLENLGNTCYMASAIQLLCGLDSFLADLKSRIPPTPANNNNKDGDDDDDDDSKSLRDELLNVMERLEKGETVRPDDLKRCIDSRTSLFLGYHQQDSHEFLTTLLDIIDEDYKIKNEEETTEESANDDDSNDDAENDENDERDESIDTKDDDSNKCATETNEEAPVEQESNDDENDSNDDGSVQKSLLSPMKKQKTVEESPSEERVAAADAIVSLQKSKSYSDFKFSDIESLLHDKEGKAQDKSSPSPLTHSKSTSKLDEPKCKLAGGRMSTAGVELTPFGESMDENVQPTGVSLENATPQQQIVEDAAADHEEMEETETATESCSPVSSNFTTKVRVCLTCESCKFRRSHIETYLHLSLDISTGSNDNNDDDNTDDNDVCNLGCPSSSSIEEGLRRFFAPEKRDIKCEKCFHTSALQTSEITQLPKNLLFHLKRFIVDVSPDYSSISYRKDQSAVVFDERMELEATQDNTKTYHPLHSLVHDDEERGFQDFLAPDCVYEQGQAYEIRSVVNHIGSSASCGHYTADAKRLTQDDDDLEREWIRFNDSYVSNITKKEAVQDASKTAYMIMYELVQ